MIKFFHSKMFHVTLDVLVVFYHLIVMAYATLLFIGSANNLVLAQNQRDYRMESLERQVGDISSLRLDQRLIRIETVLSTLETRLDDKNWWSNAANGGVGLLLARAVYQETKNRRKLNND